MNVVLVYNHGSGSAQALRDLKRTFKNNGITVDYSFSVRQLGSRKLASLIKEGVTIAVVGGDGTLNSVARLLVGTRSVLLPMPGGTFNHFVRDIMGTTDFQTIVSSVTSMKVKKIDVGTVNDELFLNNSNIGMYPFSLYQRKRTKQYVGKWIAAFFSAVDQLVVFRRHRLSIDGTAVRSPFVFIGNNIYDVEKSLIPERTKFDHGVLSLMVATSPSRLRLIRTLFDVLRGDVRRNQEFKVTSGAEITIDTHRGTIPVSFDGEVKRLQPPLVYKSRPKTLSVLCPPAIGDIITP